MALLRLQILFFANDTVILGESLMVLIMALEALHEEVKPLRLETSWAKTKVQMFGGLLDETKCMFMHGAWTLKSWKTSHTLVM